MQSGLISVIIVNWNSGHQLALCLESLAQQTHRPLEIIVVDNASSDGSLAPALAAGRVQIIRNDINAGFCRAFNQGYAISQGEFIVSLNPDVYLLPDFLARLAERLAGMPAAGLACGKLWRGDSPWAGCTLDSTGLFLSRSRRPYDRGQGQVDRGQFDRAEEVFGVCGAAWIARRTMLEDVRCLGEVLDEDFFAYYDDADLAWRARSRGWQCWYEPRAAGWHGRGGGDTLRKPSRAPKMAFAQRHAVKNRYLMMLKNDTPAGLLPALPRILAEDALRLGYMALRRPALLGAYLDVIRLLPRMLEKRREIRGRRRVPDRFIYRWFR